MKHLIALGLVCFVITSLAQETGSTAEPAAQTDTQPKEADSAPSSIDIASPARLEALKALVKRRQFTAAYSLAEPMLPVWEGDPRFDFPYGLSAVESQHYDEALFAFERLVLLHPREPRYRLELARSHFYLKNLERAEKEFNKILELSPPAPVRKNVQRFLDQIGVMRRSVESQFFFTVDIAGGYDSNINSGPIIDEIPNEDLSTPYKAFEFPLDEESRETKSSYSSALMSLYYLAPLTKTTHYDLRFLGTTRSNNKTEVYDMDTALLAAGYALNTGPVRWRLAGRYQYVMLNDAHFNDTMTGVGQIQWRTDGGWMYGLYGQYGETAYPETPSSDISQQQYSLIFACPPKTLSCSTTLVYGNDTAKDKEFDYNGKSYYGFNYQRTALWGQRGSGYWSFNMTQSNYDAINTFYGKLREDLATTLGFGWRFAFTEGFSLRNDFSASYNSSSLEIYTYKRFKAELGLTYSF